MSETGTFYSFTEQSGHILVMVHCDSHFPEAVPLQKATSQDITREIELFFSQLGLPKEILTGQGTPFLSKLMADVCQLWQFKQMQYHPQTDHLVKHFNQTLKRMLL